ncbi:MAG: response regulator [Oscillospiraceae bacterium]|nr:response regulator [Oscillospiraceae bacterium]
MAKTIFLVDDSDISLSQGEEALEAHFKVMTLPSAAKMFSLMEKMLPDLILLDIEMPDQNGFETMRLLKAHDIYAGIPVIFVTGRSDETAEALGFELGAIDFITKPFSPPILVNRVKAHLSTDEKVRERTAQLWRLKNGIISVLADLVEDRDVTTGGHIERTATYIRILLNEMLEHKVYDGDIRGWDLETVISSSRLHDVGKIRITDMILNKPGKLTSEEFDIIKTHTSEGEHIIDQISMRTGDELFLRQARKFAGYHHEKWNGSGYPYRLAGEDIPLQGRIMAVADVYDALVSERPYKKPFSHEESVDIIMKDAGTHFDPHIAEVFFNARNQFKAVE